MCGQHTDAYLWGGGGLGSCTSYSLVYKARGLVLHVPDQDDYVYRGGGKLNHFKRGRIFWVLLLHVIRE